MRLVLLIPLLSFAVYAVLAGSGKNAVPRLDMLQTQPQDPDAAKLQEQVKHPPVRGSKRMPSQPTCVDVNGAAYGAGDPGFETCRQDATPPRDTASGVRRPPNQMIEPAGVPSAARPGVSIEVGR